MKRTILLSIRKRRLKFGEQIMWKECLENWTLTEHMEGKSDKRKQRMIYITSLCESLATTGIRRDRKKANITIGTSKKFLKMCIP